MGRCRQRSTIPWTFTIEVSALSYSSFSSKSQAPPTTIATTLALSPSPSLLTTSPSKSRIILVELSPHLPMIPYHFPFFTDEFLVPKDV